MPEHRPIGVLVRGAAIGHLPAMSNALSDLVRLARAGLVFAEYGVRFVPKGQPVPLLLTVAQWASWPLRMIMRPKECVIGAL